MPELHAFRGLRYDLGHVGALSDVIAPPYDVIDSSLQTALYERHPANVIRLILNRTEPGDTDEDARYGRAARLLRSWVREGLLSRDPAPALYVYHQEFEHAGADADPTRVHGPRATAAVWGREHLPARGNPLGGESRPAQADQGLPGESQPDFRPLSRPRQRRSTAARRRGPRKYTVGGRRPSAGRASPVARDRRQDDRRGGGRDGPAADLRRRWTSSLRDRLQLPRLREREPTGGT